MKKMIITGANGFIGSTLLNRLIQEDIEVVAIDIKFDDSRIPEHKLVKKITSSLHDIDELLKLIPAGEYEAFYHFAWSGVNGVEKANPTVQLKNIQVVLNCATVAKKIRCKKFLCAGTVAEEATKSLPNLKHTSGGMMYGMAKHCARLMLETYCKNIELDFVWMQFSNIFGPNNKTGNLISYTINQLRNRKEAEFGPALQLYDFIYVDDLIEAILRIGKKAVRKNFYFIGSGKPRILKEYLIEIGQVFGTPELVKIGSRPDDGIKYTKEMFDTSDLENFIGMYVSKDFSEAIKFTVENF